MNIYESANHHGSTQPQNKLGAQLPPIDFSAHVGRAEESVSELRTRIQRLADKLVGSIPEEVAGYPEAFGGNGVLPAVISCANRIDRHVAEANDALRRIEAALA